MRYFLAALVAICKIVVTAIVIVILACLIFGYSLIGNAIS